MRQKELKELAQGHIAGKKQRWDSNSSDLTLEPKIISVLCPLSGTPVRDKRALSELQMYSWGAGTGSKERTVVGRGTRRSFCTLLSNSGSQSCHAMAA